MIKKEMEIKNKITAKGTLVGVDDEGLHIQDPKTEETEVLELDAFKMFVGKEISFSVTDSTKTESDIGE